MKFNVKILFTKRIPDNGIKAITSRIVANVTADIAFL